MENDTNWRRHLDSGTCWFQSSGFIIDLENHYGVRSLIGSQKKLSGQIDSETSGRFTLGGFRFDEVELSCFLIHGKYGNAVMPPVASIKEFPGWMHEHFCRITDTFEILGER